MKKCKICNEVKDLSQFSKNSRAKDGLRYNCKNCRSKSYYDKRDYYRNLGTIWRENNFEQFTIKNREWDSKNRKRRNSIEAKRRAIKSQATPKWLTKNQLKEIENIYVNCPKGYHVDHILPLKGKNITGLHVPWNLQYLPALENIKKGNRVS